MMILVKSYVVKLLSFTLSAMNEINQLLKLAKKSEKFNFYKMAV